MSLLLGIPLYLFIAIWVGYAYYYYYYMFLKYVYNNIVQYLIIYKNLFRIGYNNHNKPVSPNSSFASSYSMLGFPTMVSHLMVLSMQQLLSAPGRNFELILLASALQAPLFHYLITLELEMYHYCFGRLSVNLLSIPNNRPIICRYRLTLRQRCFFHVPRPRALVFLGGGNLSPMQ